MKPSRAAGAPAVRIEADNERAWCGERQLTLMPKPFAVLRHLVEHAERLITKEEFLTRVWRDVVVSDAALTTCIRDLRRALGDSPEAPRYIETVHRRGFRFIGPIARPASPAPAREAAGPGPVPAVPRRPDVATFSPPRPFVSRDAHLGQLRARLEAARAGHRRLVFVTGEPGIGKTTLVEAFLAEAGGEDSLRVGRGQCVEHYGAGEAYLPVLEALGRLGRAVGGERLVGILKRHAPVWLAQLPGLLGDDEMESVQRRAQDATRERMLRELVEALEAVTIDAPLVLLLEDLHWSDSATIDLLGMLARRREPARLLVLATYRPADVAAAGHPLRAMKHELQAHGHCEELAIEFLGVPAVEQYLAWRFPGHGFPRELARALHRNTDGNPLFLVNTVDYLIGQGQLREAGGRWELSEPVEALAPAVPRTLGQMIERQVERLTADEQDALAAASVAGAEFSAALVGGGDIDPQDGEGRCEGLARRAQFLRPAGVAEWPDGTVAGRYAFIHALYQQALYARVGAGQRVALHRRTAERLERGYGDRAGEIAGELAMHFEQGRDLERAARYRRQAGEQALRRHAYREAADQATRALDMLRALPETGERVRQELTSQVVLGAALTATRGYAAPEVARAYARARELCAQAGDPAPLLPILLGLGRFYVVRGEFETARDVATRLLAMAEAKGGATLLLAAHNALGIASFYSGDFETALAHLERGVELYDPAHHSAARSAAFRLGQDPGVSCLTHAGWTLWMLGHHARAAARIGQALALARSLGHPFSLSYACHFAAGFHQWRGERRVVQELEEEALACDVEHGFGLFLTAGEIQRGWLLAGRGKGEQGLAQMHQGVAKHRAIGAAVLVPSYLAMVAEVHGEIGQPREGLAAVDEALGMVGPSGHYWEAELFRLRGVLTIQSASGRDTGEAEACFLRAIEIARRQRATSLELRAATNLGRLWADQGRAREARALLSGIHDRFAEGPETADLREARSLLSEIAGRSGEGPA